MARSLGIHLRPDGYSFALLDGGAKRWSLGAHGSGPLDAAIDGEAGDPARALASALARALKASGAGKPDQAVLAMPALETVLRELSLPFSDREKIHQVLKFEVESDLYHLDIEEVVCDYLELADERATATLLVAAQPKAVISQAVEIAKDAGQEPPILELDLGALVTAVEATPRDPDAVAENGFEAWFHLDSCSSVLLVRGASGIRAVRKIPLGWRELARGLARDERAATVAEHAARAEAGAEQAEILAGGAPEGEDAPAPPHAPGTLFGADPGLALHLSFAEVMEQAGDVVRAALVRRLLAEIRRGLAALTGATVTRLHLLGPVLPGLAEALEQRLGVPAGPLALGGAAAAGNEDEDGAEPLDPIAFGAALRGLGWGGSAMNFRQEEFRLARGLERLEGPLTLLLVGLIAFLLVDSVILFKRTRDVLVPDTRRIFAEAEKLIGALNAEKRPEDPESWFIKGVAGLDVAEVGRIGILRSNTARARKALDEMLGEGDLVHPQSCLEAWRLVSGVLQREMETNHRARWMLESIDFTSVQPRAKDEEPYVEAKFKLTAFGQDVEASQQFDDVLSAFKIQPWVLPSPSYSGSLESAQDGAAWAITIAVKVSTVKGTEA